jgi:hypothetical protein
MNKVWIVSFPRSGNTFFRNILFHVYGINSLEDETIIDSKSNKHVYVKTHELPFQLTNYNRKKDKVVYLVRDGRDSVCSLAYKRKIMIDPDSDLNHNFHEAIQAERGSFFGGWGINILFWLKENPIIIRFEDLIENPRKIFEENLERQLNLPKANWSELPTFNKQKSGLTHFGNIKMENVKDFPNLFFRKGQIGNWKDEMNVDYQKMFNEKYSSYLHAFGYDIEGNINTIQHDLLDKIKKDTSSRISFRSKKTLWAIKDKIKSKIKNGI